MHKYLLAFSSCLLILSINLYSTVYWPPEKVAVFETRKTGVQTLFTFPAKIKPPIRPELFRPRANYPYPAEFLQIAHFLSQWQVLNPASPDYGGMIEAESGQLGNVIQTDNTQEAIVVWCQYAALTGDTITYRPNVDAAWSYIMNYPAYDEEGEPGDDYYRNHNCAWALWGVQWYETIYGDTTFRWYADSSAEYMVSHQLPVFTPQSNLNAFVMGWMAGNLYRYGEWSGHSVWIDSALVVGTKVLDWANADPAQHLADFTWAMSSGTAVWGLFNSVFRTDSLAGINWLQNNLQYLPVYYDNSDPGTYMWDSSWNVALANAYRALHKHTGIATFNHHQKTLTDTLLSLDTDDDGGIMANKLHPPTEDMTWVSAYLDVMGVDYRIHQSAAIDAGMVQIAEPDTASLYVIGDTLSVKIKAANFGLQDLTNVQIRLAVNSIQAADTIINLPFATTRNISFSNAAAIQSSGPLQIRCTTRVNGDQNPGNDTLTTVLHIPEFVSVEGTVNDPESGSGVGGTVYFSLPQRTFQTTTDPVTGFFQLQLVPGIYSVYFDSDFPYQQLTFDSLSIGQIPPPPFQWNAYRGDLVLIDDDEGAGYEFFFQDALRQIIVTPTNRSLRAFHYWNVLEKGTFPSSRVVELNRPYAIWFTGDADSSALTPAEQDSFRVLENSGACILLTGKDIAESLQGTNFLHQNLHVQYEGNSTFVPKFVYGVAGDVISDSLRFSTWGGFGANNQLYDRDIIEPIPAAQSIFYYLPQDSQSAGIRFDDSYKLVFLGFGIEGIRDDYSGFHNRSDLMLAVLNWFEGVSGTTPPVTITTLPYRFQLSPPYPNPFNRSVQLKFTLNAAQKVKLEVFNMLGQKVATITDGFMQKGVHKASWEGRAISGAAVSSGIYFFRLKGKNRQQFQKGLLLK